MMSFFMNLLRLVLGLIWALFLRLFHMHLRRLGSLLLLGGVFCIFGRFMVLSPLLPFGLSSCSIHYGKRRINVFSYCFQAVFSLQSHQCIPDVLGLCCLFYVSKYLFD